MPPKITEVKWSAENVPLGVSFNENTGTFSGEPEEAGEYTVPVTVETNYGIDTKDVIITVEPPTYGVWAIGLNAVTWSEDGTPDEYGLYGLSMPEAYKLVKNPNGFGALTAGHQYYCCGYYSVKTGIYGFENLNYTILSNDKQPKQLQGLLDRIIWGSLSYHYTEPNKKYPVTTQENGFFTIYLYGYNEKQNTYSIGTYHQGASIQKVSQSVPSGYYGLNYTGYAGGTSIALFNDNKILPPYMYRDTVSISLTQNYTPFCLCENGTKKVSARANASKDTAGSGISTAPSFSVSDLGYRAIKFLGAKFDTLSENHYLDNNPDNFTHGTIKDVWALSNSVYVQTTSNLLYEYVNDTQTWNLLGIYDVQKIELPTINDLFMLTNDGRLFHKGTAISGLFDEAHETLTHLFPALTFKDFTFGGNTLTVLRE